jgi:hypothetical protein
VNRSRESGPTPWWEAVSPRVAPEPAGRSLSRWVSQVSPKSGISSVFVCHLRGAGRIRTAGGGFADRRCDSPKSKAHQGFVPHSDRPSLSLPYAPSELPPDLALIVEHWEQLPEAVRASIVAMVKASGKGRGR